MSMTESDKVRIEAAVRTAAVVAAKGATLGEAFLNRVVAQTSDPNMSESQRVAVATSLAEQEVGVGKPVNELAASQRQLALLEQTGDFAARRYFEGLRSPRAEADRDGDRGLSARYASLPGEWTVAKLQGLAKELGVGWAANNPDLLKLGPSAIQALADVHLKEKNYNKMTDFGLTTAKEKVEVAKKARKEGIDIDGVMDKAGKVDEQIPPEHRREFRGTMKDHLHHLDKPGIQEKTDKSLDAIARKAPSVAPQIDDLKRKMRERHKMEKVSALNADIKEAKADSKDAKADTKVADASKSAATLDDSFESFGKETAAHEPKPARVPASKHASAATGKTKTDTDKPKTSVTAKAATPSASA